MTRCKFSGCEDHAVYLSEHCWDHTPDKVWYKNALLEHINASKSLKGRNLRKIVLKDAQAGKANFSGANLSQADLSGSQLFDANLEGADLVGTNLSGAELTHSNLRNADLTKASLIRARLWNADLSGSNLTECDLSDADLWNAVLFKVKLWHTNFMRSKFLSMRNFHGKEAAVVNHMINEEGLLSAEESYMDLKRYFLENGMYKDASWAAFKEKTMERRIFRKNGNLNYIPSAVMNILCGYGEKTYRIVLSALLTIMLFAFLYHSMDAMQSSISANYRMSWADYIYVSAITFTTVGYGDFVPKEYPLFRLLAAAEAFTGVFLTGLFIFTLARKYSAR